MRQSMLTASRPLTCYFGNSTPTLLCRWATGLEFGFTLHPVRRMVARVVGIDFEIRHLFISAGHNFVGHHQKPPADYANVEVTEIHCVTRQGITGDRYYGHKNSRKGNITFFEEETYQDLCAQFGVWDRGPEVFRRNVITRGINLNELIGIEFELQGVRIFGDEECRPCYWMDRVFAAGAENAMKGRGGLRATILSDGVLRKNEQ